MFSQALDCILLDLDQGLGKVSPHSNCVSGVPDCSTINDFLKLPSHKLIVIGGRSNSDILSSTEMFDLADPLLKCNQHSLDLPVPLAGATGQTMQLENGTHVGVICGGAKTDHENNRDCYILGHHQPFTHLERARHGLASVLINEGTVLFATGGITGQMELGECNYENHLSRE